MAPPIQTRTEPKLRSDSRRGDRRLLEQHVEIPKTSASSSISAVATIKTERASHQFDAALHNHGKPGSQEPLSKGARSTFPPDFDSKIPLILSPTGTTSSAASSPGANNDIWDSPETPSHLSARKHNIEILTPLTPPTTYDASETKTPITKTTGSFLKKAIKSETIFEKLTARIASSDAEEGELKDTSQSEDYFGQKKIFRNLTKDFQAGKSEDAKQRYEYI